MVATFAHELAHFLLATSPEPLPVPDEEVEFLTDLTAVFLGFGLFLCNTRFRYEQFSDGVSAGWSMKRQGYCPSTTSSLPLLCSCQRAILGMQLRSHG